MSNDNNSEENTGTEGLEDFLNGEAAKSMQPPQQRPPGDDALPPSSPPPPIPTPAASANKRKANEVFSEGMKTMSRQDVASRDFGFEIPVDAVPLPSAGKVYPETHPLHGAKHVEYRGMTAKEEDILMSQALIKRGTVITELIKSCLVNKNINVNSLISGDRNAMMVAIRISGYGREYNPTFMCPNCSHKNEMKVDLANLNIKALDLEPSHPGQNIFKFKLPISGKEVEFKFLTGKEEEEVMKETENKKKRGLQNNNLVTTRLMSSLVSVDGNESTSFIASFVSVMPARDSLTLRKYIDKHEPGVDMEVEFTCSDCEYFDNIQLPMGSSFFWPDA